MTGTSLNDLRQLLAVFAAARDWEQFHTPKNLTTALAGEAGELLEIFQWLTPEEAASIMSSDRAENVRDELADIFAYLVRLADVLDVNLDQALRDKLAKNERRYPVDRSRGNAVMYTEWRDP